MTADAKYYVRMTDRFLSGWGRAKGRSNVLVIECDTIEQADAIEAAALRRSEMTHVRICTYPPAVKRGVLYSRRHFIEMGGVWKNYYRVTPS